MRQISASQCGTGEKVSPKAREYGPCRAPRRGRPAGPAPALASEGAAAGHILEPIHETTLPNTASLKRTVSG